MAMWGMAISSKMVVYGMLMWAVSMPTASRHAWTRGSAGGGRWACRCAGLGCGVARATLGVVPVRCGAAGLPDAANGGAQVLWLSTVGRSRA